MDVSSTELEVSRTRLEAALGEAVSRYTDLKERLTGLQAQRNLGKGSAITLSQLGQQVQEASREVERRRASLAALDIEMRHTRRDRDANRVRELQEADEALRAQLEALRAELVEGLTAMADLFRMHAQLVEKKDQVARELSQATGKDCRYTNYIDCAVLRRPEYEGDVEFVVEAIKRLRVVA
jgi:chromosome segregation ATPase